MSDQITVARVLQFKANVLHMYQQNGSLLKGLVREEDLVGKAHFFDRLGATAAVKRTTRHADTPLVNSPHSRRMVVPVDFEWADLIDKQDRIRMLWDPQGPYAINAAKALGRAYDDEVIFAFDADAKGGEDGSSTVTFASEAAGDLDPSAAAVTLADVVNVKTKLDLKDVPEAGRHFLVSPEFLGQLLKQTTTPNFTSADYQMVKALVNGEINSGLGFQWHKTTRLPTAAGTDKYAFAWHEDAMGIAINQDITTDIGPRRDKSLSTQVYVAMTMGATRIQGEGVVRVRFDSAL